MGEQGQVKTAWGCLTGALDGAGTGVINKDPTVKAEKSYQAHIAYALSAYGARAGWG